MQQDALCPSNVQELYNGEGYREKHERVTRPLLAIQSTLFDIFSPKWMTIKANFRVFQGRLIIF
jgi:hypothetical protein